MHTTSSWIRRNVELILKSFVKFFRYVPEFLTKILLHHLQKKIWLHSFKNLAILADGMYNKKNVDYVALLWEDFMYQADNREIICLQDTRLPSVWSLIPDDMINQDIKDSQAYKTCYNFATGKVPPRKARKYKKVASPPRKLSPVKEAEPVKKGKRVKRPTKKSTTAPTVGVILRDTPGVPVSKKKSPAKGDKSKGIEILSYVALSEAVQLKEAIKRSKKDFHISQASGSGDGTDLESGVPDEQQRKTSGTKGTGTRLGVFDVPTYDFKSENESWGNSEDDNDIDSKGDDDKVESDDDGNSDADDNERIDSDDDDENPSFTLKDYDEEEHDEEYESDDDYENMFE
ncbi:hypothetical protein Tco_0754676 [Tanacetum coccineum]